MAFNTASFIFVHANCQNLEFKLKATSINAQNGYDKWLMSITILCETYNS